MKKYLIITPQCPYPPHKDGGVHTVYNILKHLPKNVEMDLFYYFEKDNEAERIIGHFVNKIFHKKLVKNTNVFSRAINFAKRNPDCFTKMRLDQMSEFLDYGTYDIVILDQIISLPFSKFIPANAAIISLMHDNHVLMYQRKQEQEHAFIKKLYDQKQCSYFLRIEDKYFERVVKVIYVSSLDSFLAQKMHSKYKGIFDNITLGVDMPDKSQISAVENPYSFVFSGVMDYGPNEDAALFFANKVFPKISKKYPDARFIIAGKNPTDSIMHLKSRNIIVTGFVEDMTKTITKSAIYVSPLRYGTGTKNKILEAMAAEMPVIATEVSREGIDGLMDRENCFFATEENFADVLLDVLSDNQLMAQVAKKGKAFVEQHHSWQNVFDKFLID